MSKPLILLRPQPGNDASAQRARAMGLDVVQAPLFETVAIDAGPLPPGPFDAVLLTSANGARFAPELFVELAHLPLYAVGTATAQAAHDRGHDHVVTGGGDSASTAAMLAKDGHHHVLHVCGEDVRAFDPHGLAVERHAVYRARTREATELEALLNRSGPAVAAVHSPRAGQRLAALIEAGERPQISIVAISAAALAACGNGWAETATSATPEDTALLACAEALCNHAGQ